MRNVDQTIKKTVKTHFFWLLELLKYVLTKSSSSADNVNYYQHCAINVNKRNCFNASHMDRQRQSVQVKQVFHLFKGIKRLLSVASFFQPEPDMGLMDWLWEQHQFLMHQCFSLPFAFLFCFLAKRGYLSLTHRYVITNWLIDITF